jgi:hypothetical protein
VIVVGGDAKVLHLTLKRDWFEMIACGEKPEEYREIKPYWTSRLQGKMYRAIQFRNGYRRDAATMLIELVGVWVGEGRPEWGAPTGKLVYILKLGLILVPPLPFP